MALFFRRRQVRAAAAVPWPTYSVAGASYAAVDVSSLESSMQAIAVRSSVDLIASLVSELPVDVFTGRGQARRQIPTPGYLDDPAGDGHGMQDWLYQALESWLLRGNLFGDILDVGPGAFPRQVDLQHPDRVRGRIEDGHVQWSFGGRDVDTERVLHRRVNPVPGVVLGMSPIQAHAADLGLNLTLTRFGLQWFTDGAHPGAVVRNTEKELSEQTARTVKDRFLAAVRGREPAVFGKGWEYLPIKISPEESQFLETRGFSSAECARIFGPGIAEILGYQQSGATLTYANLQDRSVHLLVYALGKWLRRADRLLSLMLPRPQYARLNRDALLETTTLTRFQAHESALKNRWRTVNEVRAIEDLPRVPWGDQPNGSTPPQPAGDGQDPPEGDGGGGTP